MQAEVADNIRSIFNAPDRATAEAYLAKTIAKYQQNASRLSEWLAGNILEGLTVFSFPADHWAVATNHERCGEIASRDPAESTCGEHLPKPGFLPTICLSCHERDQ
jgi:transposase-like protein